MATAPAFITLSNGEKLAVGVYNSFVEMAAAMKREIGYTLWVASGYRTHAEQVRIFTDRYEQRAVGNGPYNDVRHWDGLKYGYGRATRWVRVKAGGTVAVPGTSLHEKASAVDFGGPAGQKNTAANRWLRKNGAKYGFSDTGARLYGEPWHFDYTKSPWAGGGSNPFPKPPVPPKPEPTPEPEPDPTIGDLMAFKSIAVGHRPVADQDRIYTTALDWENGQKTSETIVTKDYGTAYYKALTEGGFVIVSKGHYDQILADFKRLFPAA